MIEVIAFIGLAACIIYLARVADAMEVKIKELQDKQPK